MYLCYSVGRSVYYVCCISCIISLHYLCFQYIDSEIMRNFILAGIAIFIVTLLLIVDFVTSFFVLVCVGLTLVRYCDVICGKVEGLIL